ncbi:slr1658 superfamily regulator [Pararhodospirillum photometricum]|nr:hypothetical protein [Pararhodospirillum photometricum]
MIEQIGVADDPAPGAILETLSLSFSPSLLPLRQRWRNNGLSADFLGDYVTTFFPAEANDPATRSRQAQARAAVAYVANELLENAMKYSLPQAREPITLRLILEPTRITVVSTNPMAADRVEPFRALVARLAETDPLEAYLAAVEEKALHPEVPGSGLGLVTMRNDYGACLGWRFAPQEEGVTEVTTIVQLMV